MKLRRDILALVFQIFLRGSEGAKQILCNNAGLQYAVFNSTQPPPSRSGYPEYNPNYMKDPSVGGQGTANLIYNATTPSVGGWGYSATGGFSCSGNFSIHGSPQIVPCENYSVMYRGYLNPTVSGVYTVATSEVDDLALLWLGSSTAQQGWNRRNDLMESFWGGTWPTQSTTVNGQNATFQYLKAGNYYPIRIIYTNARTYQAFLLNILDPFGSTILGPKTGQSVNVVQYSCDGSTAPPFPYDWGKEA